MVRWGALSMLAALLACGSDPTQVVIVVDTNLTIPTEVDAVRITVRAPDGEMQSAQGGLVAGEPRTLAQTHTGGPLGPFEVTVDGLVSSSLVVSRRATFDFQPGRRLALPMHLVRSCVSAVCGDETCSEAGCRPIAIAPGEMEPWRGVQGLGDAGVQDDACIPIPEVCDTRDQDCDGLIDEDISATETCNDFDDDCDGMTDEGFDKLNDPDFCGDCVTECRPPDRDCCDGVCGRCS